MVEDIAEELKGIRMDIASIETDLENLKSTAGETRDLLVDTVEYLVKPVREVKTVVRKIALTGVAREALAEVLVQIPLKKPVLEYRGDILVCQNCLWLIDNLLR